MEHLGLGSGRLRSALGWFVVAVGKRPGSARRVSVRQDHRVPLTRPIAPAEHAVVADLTASVYRGEGFSSADYEPALRDVASRAASATVLVALDDAGRVIGAVTVATRGGEWAEQAAPGEAVIRMLAVAPDARGSGAGEALVRACLAQACDDACAMVRLSSQEDMRAAHRLYERLGFTRTPSLDWNPVPELRLRTYALPLVPWCGQCGQALTGDGHEPCRRAATLDPPRFCGHCRRRMVVQVLPTGWTARCSEHGLLAG
ncbi:MAG: GNAT family N-acetyltransferase [Frankiales bacterium]|nr:GNAT family N-acetyltransferase [Frankiales bacterium]